MDKLNPIEVSKPPTSQNEISFYFRDLNRYPKNEKGERIVDRLTGIPLLHDHIRSHLMDKFSDAIKNGKGWLMLTADADNLKKINKRNGRSAGDELIIKSTSIITKAFDPSSFSKDAEIFAVRHGEGADEVFLLAVNVTPEEIQAARQQQGKLESPFPLEKSNLICSISSSIYTSEDEGLQGAIRVHRKLLNEGGGRVYDFYKALEKLEDRDIAFKKLQKELRHHEDLIAAGQADEALYLAEQIGTVAEDVGDGRVSSPALEYLLQVHALQGAQLKTDQIQEVLARNGHGNLLESLGINLKLLTASVSPEAVANAFIKGLCDGEAVDGVGSYTPLFIENNKDTSV